jgi:PAS domain S-box-containing protein
VHDEFRALLEAAPDAMVIGDADGKISLVNAQTAKLFGYNRDELLGQPVEMLMPERYHGGHVHHRRSYTESHRLRPMGAGRELYGLRKDGSEFPVEISLSPFRSEQGMLVFSAIRDITLQKIAQNELREAKHALETRVRERTAELVTANEALQSELAMGQRDSEQERSRRLEEQLLLSQKMEAIGRLAGGIAHDFNNLLGVILGNAEMMLKAGPPGARHVERVEQIKLAGEEAATVTKQLLAFARQQVSEPQTPDLNVVLTDLDPLLRRIVEENIRLEMALSRDLGDIENDQSQLSQVILNLVANARDAMKKGGRLLIETSNTYLGEAYARDHLDVVPGPYVQLSVTDSGEGMDKETVSRIFEPFFTTKEQGSGWAWLGHRVWNSAAKRRAPLGVQRAGTRNHVQDLLAARFGRFCCRHPECGRERNIEWVRNDPAGGRFEVARARDAGLPGVCRVPRVGRGRSGRGAAPYRGVSRAHPHLADRRGDAAYERAGIVGGAAEEAARRKGTVYVRALRRSDLSKRAAGRRCGVYRKALHPRRAGAEDPATAGTGQLTKKDRWAQL